MNSKILHKEVQDFINKNIKSDVPTLILKGSPFEGITIQEIANQIVSKQKCEKKLPTWFATNDIYYPPKLNIEQTSSETTANYKSQLISGKKIIDITGGLGVDSYAFSKVFEEVNHCEINEELSTISQYNFTKLQAANIKSITGSGIDFLAKTEEHFDAIFIDPSRRNDVKGKVFLLEDCEPNFIKHQELFFKKASTILLKVSPILDISNTLRNLHFVKEIHVVAVGNEVKELLFLLQKNYQETIHIKTINIAKNGTQNFEFMYQTEAISEYALPLKYLYEPNVAILKSGAFHHISEKYQLFKLHQHSHLYTSESWMDFPGRTFSIEKILPYDKKKIAKLLPNKKANVTTRNFPKTVAQVREELKLKGGGTDYLFFTTNCENQLLCLVCKKTEN